jgi:hypothetical protein
MKEERLDDSKEKHQRIYWSKLTVTGGFVGLFVG